MTKLFCRTRDWFWEPDKLQHILLSLMMVQLFCHYTSLPVSLSLAWAVGLVKELWDWRYGAGFSRGDIVANTLGVTLGGVLIWPWL